MIRKLVLLILLIPYVFFSSYAQELPKENKWTDLERLAEIPRFDFRLDFTYVNILGLSYEDYKTMDPEWALYEARFLSYFISSFNAEASIGKWPHSLGYRTSDEYSMVLQISHVAKNGSHVYANLYVFNQNGQIFFYRSVEAKKGRIGSVCNLMGDALNALGHDVGRSFYYNAVNKSKNN